eukprot:Em0003g202a
MSESEEVKKKKRIRAGHRASATRISTQAKENLESTEFNPAQMKQHVQFLKDKLRVISQLDAEIVDLLQTEEETTREIEQSDTFKEGIELAMINFESAVAETSRTPTRNRSRANSDAASEEQEIRTDIVNEVSRPNSAASQSTTTEPATTISQHENGKMTQACKVKLPKLVLKKFDGGITNWSSFWDSFESSIHQNPDLTEIDKFIYLKSLLESSAAEVISGLTLSSSNYTEALSLLKKRFGNKQHQISKHMDALMNLEPVVTSRNLKALRQLYDKVESHIRCLRSLGVESESYGTLLSSVLMKRIPHDICLVVSRTVTTDDWKLDKLLAAVGSEIEAREKAAQEEAETLQKPTKNPPTTAALLSTPAPACCYCGESHQSSSCRTVPDIDQRRQCLLKMGRCFVCLRRGHKGIDCRSSLKCSICQGRHHLSICPRPRQANNSQPGTSPSVPASQNSSRTFQAPAVNGRSSTMSMYVSTKTPILLQTARVKVNAPNRESPVIDTRIVFDSGSQRSYISNKICEALGLKVERKERLVVKTFGVEEGRSQECGVVRLSVKTKAGSNVVLTLLAVSTICEPLVGQPLTFATNHYSYLSGLDMADSSDQNDHLEVGILIGADNYWSLMTGRIRKGRTGPTAVETDFGWVLSGPVKGLSTETTSVNLLSCHVLNVGMLSPHSDTKMEQILHSFWDLETLGIKSQEGSVYDNFMRTISYEDGRYCVSLPWKDPNPLLPDNFNLCQARLFEILLRFRLFPVALVADIEKAFLMVSVVKEDRDALRFLWLDDISSDCPSVQVLRFTRIVFGVSASPFLLNATIKRHIEGYRSEDSGFVEKFQRSIYVDDVTFGAESAEKAFKLYQQSKLWLAKGGFNLRKFVTNCPELQSRINWAENHTLDQSDGTDPARVTSEDMSYVKNTLGDNLNNLEGLKVLGVRWNPESDLLLFDIQHITELATKLQPTKRNVIGLAARFFDPLGVISPVTVQFKLLFQNICVKNVSWDEPLSCELLERWEKLLDGLKQVHSITIPRCYFSNWTSCSLRGFCDASQHAYAAVVYLLIETDGSCYSKLVVAKTRVCPLQKHSIPRLELLGALLLSRLLSWAHSALRVELRLEPSICYTDSIVVLYWIKRVDKEWKQFVENRVTEIRRLAPAAWWQHCPGADNPADMPSRGMDPLQLVNNPLWFNGPRWLCESSSEGLSDSCIAEHVPEGCATELKVKDSRRCQESHSMLVSDHKDPMIRCENFSSLKRLLKVTAIVYKFIQVLKMRRRGTEASVRLEAKDIIDAELYWIRIAQEMLLQDEKFTMWKTQLGLYLDDLGLWRCKGRLSNAELPMDAKHPILLPSKHHITILVAQDCHKHVMHGGIKETLAELRGRFWIIKGRSFLRNLLHQCTICARINARPCESPPLPQFRVREYPPFNCVGVDYAGPLYVKSGEKVWISLFSCCVTRAIHLEVVPDMSTESFIRCFKRFAARRGTPSIVVSDNSKTFRSAHKELAQIQTHPVVENFFTEQRIEWRFNLEKAPWWGGFFERMVGSVKRCLKKVIGHARLTFDELLTVIVEVEGTLNSRPLTYLSADDFDEPLTPARLLTGRRLHGLPDTHVSSELDLDFVTSSTHSAVTSRMKHLQLILQHFWKRWKTEYLIDLRETHRFSTNKDKGYGKIALGDIVLVHDDNHPRTFWRLGRVEQLIQGSDGHVRGAVVRVSSKTGSTTLRRPLQRLYPLEIKHPDAETPVTPDKQQGTTKKLPRRAAAEIAKLKLTALANQSDESELDY